MRKIAAMMVMTRLVSRLDICRKQKSMVEICSSSLDTLERCFATHSHRFDSSTVQRSMEISQSVAARCRLSHRWLCEDFRLRRATAHPQTPMISSRTFAMSDRLFVHALSSRFCQIPFLECTAECVWRSDNLINEILQKHTERESGI